MSADAIGVLHSGRELSNDHSELHTTTLGGSHMDKLDELHLTVLIRRRPGGRDGEGDNNRGSGSKDNGVRGRGKADDGTGACWAGSASTAASADAASQPSGAAKVGAALASSATPAAEAAALTARVAASGWLAHGSSSERSHAALHQLPLSAAL